MLQQKNATLLARPHDIKNSRTQQALPHIPVHERQLRSFRSEMQWRPRVGDFSNFDDPSCIRSGTTPRGALWTCRRGLRVSVVLLYFAVEVIRAIIFQRMRCWLWRMTFGVAPSVMVAAVAAAAATMHATTALPKELHHV